MMIFDLNECAWVDITEQISDIASGYSMEQLKQKIRQTVVTEIAKCNYFNGGKDL